MAPREIREEFKVLISASVNLLIKVIVAQPFLAEKIDGEFNQAFLKQETQVFASCQFILCFLSVYPLSTFLSAEWLI